MKMIKCIDLPNLQSITIGNSAFYYGSFEIRGIDMILKMIKCIDLPNLQSITLGGRAFKEFLTTIIESIE